MKKLFAIYPPGRKFMRGEERCQSNIESSTSTAIRACNDLGYLCAVMRQEGWEVRLKDFQTESLNTDDLFADLADFLPDVLFISVTNATLVEDLEICCMIRSKYSEIVIILKGAVFFIPPQEFFLREDLQCADYLIAEEAECIIRELLDAHYQDRSRLKTVPRIYYKEGSHWVGSENNSHMEDLDSLPFPARDLMKNKLYVRPDTGRPMASISTSRGCASACTFCMTPPMSGRKQRSRSPQNIVAEIRECVDKYGIYDFFFRADTFTADKNQVLEVCRLLHENKLAEKIRWVANARAVTVDAELLSAMKQAGCWLIAIGFESGSDETLKRIRKGSTSTINLRAADLIHQAGIKLFGFYMIGFPWEDLAQIKMTEELIWKTRPDFLELHLAVPFYGTELFREAKEMGCLKEMPLGCDYFKEVPLSSLFFTAEQLRNIRKKIINRYIYSLPYLFRRLLEVLREPGKFMHYATHALSLLKQK